MRKEHKTAYAVAGYSSRTRLPDARSIPDEHSLHLALRGKNGVWQPLNFGIGVLFAEADFRTKDPAGLTILLDQVDLYRCPDGRIAVTADLITEKGVLRGRAAWQTTVLVHYSLTVSYTHLDVYKRQSISPPAKTRTCTATRLWSGSRASRRPRAAAASRSAMRTKKGFTATSPSAARCV